MSTADAHGRFGGVIPAAASEAAQPALAELNEKVAPLVEQYLALMEKIKLKDGIRMAMNVSFAGNKFFQVILLADTTQSPYRTRSSRGRHLHEQELQYAGMVWVKSVEKRASRTCA